MTEDPLQLVLLGPPASGKGTQGRRLAGSFKLDYLSTGALLREVVASESDEGEAVRPILERGGFVPDELMFRFVGRWLDAHRGGWVLDGFPRTLGQDDFLREWLESHRQRVNGAVILEVPKPELIRRIEGRVECPTCRWSGQREQLEPGDRCPTCGSEARQRADDSLENFLSRHEEFERHTLPVAERYREAGLLHVVDATAPIDAVSAGLRETVESLTKHGET